MIDNSYIIYTLNHPESKEIRYVGVTKHSLKTRYYQHIHSGRKRVKTTVSKWIKYLLENNLKPEINTLEKVLEKDWEDREKYWILYYKGIGIKLLNQHEGGKGIINKSKQSIHKSSISKYKPIYQCDNEYNVIKLWDSVTTAAKTLNINRDCIYKCLEQKPINPTGKGYKWVHKDLYDSGTYLKKYVLNKEKRKDVINMIEKSKSGTIKIFSTIKDLSDYLGIPRHIIDRKLKKGSFAYNDNIYEKK